MATAKTQAEKQAAFRNSQRIRQIEFFEDMINQIDVINLQTAALADKMQRAIKKLEN